jgi:hypothetical protein
MEEDITAKELVSVVKIDFTETELSVLHSIVSRQLYRFLQAKEQGHIIDENTMLPTLRRLKEKTSVRSSKKEAEIIRILT